MPVIGFQRPTDKPARRYSSDPKTRAAELVADGKIGGKRDGAGRPRKSTSESQSLQRRPAAQAVARAAREHADKIGQVFIDVLEDDDASDRQKVHAMRALIGIEQKEAALQLEEESAGRTPADEVPSDRGELTAALAAKLANDPLLRQQFSRLLAAAGSQTDVPPKSS